MHRQLAAPYKYDRTFFEYINVGSTNSAQVIAPILVKALNLTSVLDLGCGTGAWLNEYRNCGVVDILGIDGDYVDSQSLLIPVRQFSVQDVTHEFSVHRRFDLVQCLEVGEHLPMPASEILVKNLTAHSDKVLFSAAVPGQGGENHINEQCYEFWRHLFADHGYVPFDFVRPLIRDATGVEQWYRYNMLLYVKNEATPKIPDFVMRSRIPDNELIPDLSSWRYKVRKALLRQLSPAIASKLAIIKHRSIVAFRKAKYRF